MNDIMIRVSTEELKQKADTVDEKVRNFQAAVDEAEKLIADTSAYWLGEAGNSKREKYSLKKDSIREMISRLHEYTLDLKEMAGIYDPTEINNQDLASSLPMDIIV